MADRPSPYDRGLRFGLPDPSYVSDAEWREHLKQKNAEDATASAERHKELAEGFAAAQERIREINSTGFQGVVNDAIREAVERRNVVETPKGKRLASLGYVELQDGTLVRREYLEAQARQEQTETPDADGWLPIPRMVSQEEINSYTDDEEEDSDE